MTIRVAINGYGRIGRNVLRALYESGKRSQIQIVGINDLGDAKLNAHLTKYDSVHGTFNGTVAVEGDHLIVNGDAIRITSERDPAKLPWGELNVDVVYECTGIFTSKEKASAHLAAGAKKVIISAPGTEVDATVVFGVNHNVLKATDSVISNASCTTNCLAPVAKVLNDKFGIVQGSMTTIHAYTNDQVLSDVFHKDIYRARSATQSMIPTTTGAAKAVGLVLPELKGKLDGISVRVPTINVSLVDLNVLVEKDVSVEAINAAMKEAAEKEMPGVLAYVTEPLVSVDFNHNPHSSNYDSLQTKVYGKWVKVLSWYDNEWGFSNRMLDNTLALMSAK
ncbi:type I glyceraldehyde-3-phosphate dehydrogenase [Cellvibrio japonicus]|uniref:Glyceraldehyde-3-phosphate dehydrogenase n=1 Tax=Cellvibrio japonicus (strain Ueda107) TaxID=498211 RepID=B3PCZ0_CELJU|nr:type I glyceraldehyde-3-phosphate dehydrogenase [Cellvibrio japonicus]ACE84769.1 glyceraldehyde-3-phosphate dehydrogenase, type I [Cellvibrio japonicus Ueda107]QEI11933.1 type I glyceraldehyde-3-phosphate dehydrogenase [Cellvibrio japonicus]QEI15507.1 type I glyceraldehyde-3-phosphate dehydrogenase [Cellvibrio japonicus]QEI19086.1 type I glyceraldehyde-3-phosphate dehydrogenase [Cellvibrio japonicus]